MLCLFRSTSINFSINLCMNFIIKLAWTSKMARFVQLSKDIVNIRGVTDPKSEDGDEQVHGFVGNQLFPVFRGKLSSSEQFQNLHWTQIQNYLRQSYDSNHLCDVSVMVSDGTIVLNRLIIILLFPDVLHVPDDDLELVIVPDFSLDQIKDNIKSLLNFSNTSNISASDCNNNNSVDDVNEISLVSLGQETPSEVLTSSLTRLIAKLHNNSLSEDDLVNTLEELAE